MRTVVGLGLVVVMAVSAWLLLHRQHGLPLLERPVPQAVLKDTPKETFFTLIAAYCRKHPGASDAASCAMCSAETCPDCGFGPERTALVGGCNPSGWDCAASFLFAPNTGGSCVFGTASDTCRCPQAGAPAHNGAAGARRFAGLSHVPVPAAPFSPRIAP